MATMYTDLVCLASQRTRPSMLVPLSFHQMIFQWYVPVYVISSVALPMLMDRRISISLCFKCDSKKQIIERQSTEHSSNLII